MSQDMRVCTKLKISAWENLAKTASEAAGSFADYNEALNKSRGIYAKPDSLKERETNEPIPDIQ